MNAPPPPAFDCARCGAAKVHLEGGTCAKCAAAPVRVGDAIPVFTPPTFHPCVRCARPGAVFLRGTTCEACNARELAAEQRRERIALGEETIPDGYRWCRFGAELPAPAGWQAIGRQVVERRNRARGIVFVGPAGSGKSSLATAMFRLWMRVWGERGEWMHAHALSRARNAHRLGAGEAKLVERAYDAPLLLVDEVRDDKAGATSTIYDVIQERHARGLPTWATTGLCEPRLEGGRRVLDAQGARDAVALAYGDGIARRLFEGTVIDLFSPPPRAVPAPASSRPNYDAAMRRAGDDT